MIILDPPRDGIHPKALGKIIDYGVKRIVYISCKPTSLVRDLVVFQERGYQVEKVCAVDMFPSTGNVEVCCRMSLVDEEKNREKPQDIVVSEGKTAENRAKMGCVFKTVKWLLIDIRRLRGCFWGVWKGFLAE